MNFKSWKMRFAIVPLLLILSSPSLVLGNDATVNEPRQPIRITPELFDSSSYSPTPGSPPASDPPLGDLGHLETDQICSSPSFELTVDNWWSSGANQFLSNYIAEHYQSHNFLHHGLISSLARTYLADPTIGCGLNTPHRCSIPCHAIVRKSPDLATARILYFTFTQAQHISEVLRTIHDGLAAAQTTVGQMAEGMSNDFTYRGKGHDIWLRSMGFLMNKLVGLLVELFPMKRTGRQIRRVILMQIKMEYETLARAGSGEKLGRMDAMRDSRIRLGLLEKSLDELEKVFDEYAILKGMDGVRFLMEYWRDRLEVDVLRNLGAEKGQKENAMFIVEFVRTTTTAARRALREVSLDMFGAGRRQRSPQKSRTIFQNVAFMGNFLLPGADGDVGFYQGADMEEKITRVVMLKALNAIWRSQKIYITCTKDFRRTAKPHRPVVEQKTVAASCRRDNSGPPEFKACVGEYVCYMYKWSDRGPKPAWHNERPPGKDVLEEHPWDLEIKDVITSSVQGYLTDVRQYNYSIAQTISGFTNFSPKTFSQSFDASTPGMFTIPVCFSTHNWATVLAGHSFPLNALHNITPRNPIKSIPCNCGPWGRDTQEVWKDLGIWKPYPGFKNLSVDKCGYQIYDRIKDTVERFIAYCRVDVRTTMAGRVRWAGGNGDCDLVAHAVEKLGSPAQLKKDRPEVHRALECRTNQGEWATRRGCNRYKKGTLRSVLRVLGVVEEKR